MIHRMISLNYSDTHKKQHRTDRATFHTEKLDLAPTNFKIPVALLTILIILDF